MKERVYVVTVMDGGADIHKDIFMLEPKAHLTANRPIQFCVDLAARSGERLLDVVVTDIPSNVHMSSGDLKGRFGCGWRPGDAPNPILANYPPINGGWSGRNRKSDRGY